MDERVAMTCQHEEAVPARDAERGIEQRGAAAAGDRVVGGAGGGDERLRVALPEPGVAVVGVRRARIAEHAAAVDEERVVVCGRVGRAGGHIVAHRFRRKPGAAAEEPEGHVVVVIVAEGEPASGCAAVLHTVEVGVAAERTGLEADLEIAGVERAVQDGPPEIAE